MAETEYISVSEYAAFIDRTTTTVYTQIRDGIVPSKKIGRGNADGFIIPKPQGYDDWKKMQDKRK